MPVLQMDIHRLVGLVLTVATIAGATFITNDSSAIATSFEYIIVGGGTTGLAIANRLSVHHTVLVVERGDDEINNEVKFVDYRSGYKVYIRPSSIVRGSTIHLHRSGREYIHRINGHIADVSSDIADIRPA